MSHCKDCKHWDGNDRYSWCGVEGGEEPGESPHGRCGRVLHMLDERRVGGPGKGGESPGSNDEPFLTDGEMYAACLWTPPEFGCVLWEPKS